MKSKLNCNSFNQFHSDCEFSFLLWSFSGVEIMKKETKAAIVAVQVKIIIGTGGATSARSGANIVASLAPMLQIPKAVPAKIAGKI